MIPPVTLKFRLLKALRPPLFGLFLGGFAAAVSADAGITVIASPSFGNVSVGPAGRDFYLRTNGSIQGSGSSDYYGGAQGGEYLVTGDGNPADVTVQTTNISVSSGLTLTYIKCKYGKKPLRTCSNTPNVWPSPDPSGTSLLMGIRVVTATEMTVSSTESVSYDLEVIYN